MSKITNDDDNRVSNEVAASRRCILTTLRTIPSLNGWHATSIFFQVLRRLLPFLFGQPSITLWQWGSKGAALCNYILWHFCIQFARSHRIQLFPNTKAWKKTEPIFVIIYFGLFLRVKLYLKHDKRFYWCEYVLTLKYEACRRITS